MSNKKVEKKVEESTTEQVLDRLAACTAVIRKTLPEIEAIVSMVAEPPAENKPPAVPADQRGLYTLWLTPAARKSVEEALRASNQSDLIALFEQASATSAEVEARARAREEVDGWLLDVIDVLERMRGRVKPRKRQRHSATSTAANGARYVIEYMGKRYESTTPAWVVTNAQRGLKAAGVAVDRETLRALVQEIPSPVPSSESEESVTESLKESADSESVSESTESIQESAPESV